MRDALRALARGESLDAESMQAALGAVMRGEATPVQVGGLLMGLRARGETVDELAGAVRALRAEMVSLPAARPDELVDTCGTGGGTVTTFNISTVAAFVAAAAGVRVAKHGNRSYTSKCGSADVLEALGVPLDAAVPVMARVLDEAGIVFMFAPRMHPAMRHVAAVRRELAVTTVMNAAGPLANPAGAARQVIGVGDPERLELMAGAAAALGLTHALVVHGEPGLDEVSPLGPTVVVEVRRGVVHRWCIDPSDYGLRVDAIDALAGGDPADNARLARLVLAGRGTPAARSAVALNAAAAIYVASVAPTYAAAISLALSTLDTGAGLIALDRMLAAYRSAVG